MDFPFFLLVAFLCLGLFTGFMAGLLGIGGGLVLVPSLVVLFSNANLFETERLMHMALGTSMATIIFTSLASAVAHQRFHNIEWQLVKNIGAGVLLGTWLGAFLAKIIPPQPLAIFYTAFVVFTAANMVMNLNAEPRGSIPRPIWQGLAGGFIGALSAIVSIGGGSLIVPFLHYCGVPIKRAIGTSSAIGVAVAFGGTLGYVYNGWAESTSAWEWGYVYVPALIVLLIASHLTAPLGALCTQKWPIKRIKQIFALLLVILAIRMLAEFF